VKRRASPESPGRGRIAIVFLGKSGSGKSSLIAALSGQRVTVEHSLSSGTTRLQKYRLSNRYCAAIGYEDVVLVDTPSFDNSAIGDDVVLEEIRSGLQQLQEKNITIASIVCTHRISDTRMNGSARKSLDLCKAICGYDAAPRLAFVTTGWDVVENDPAQERAAIQRESTLARDHEFWGDFIEKGSHTFRSHGAQRSALKVLKKLHIDPRPRKLQLLDEYDDSGSLSKTSAYSVLIKSLEASIDFTPFTRQPRHQVADDGEENAGLAAFSARERRNSNRAVVRQLSHSFPQDIHRNTAIPVHDYYQQKFRIATPPYSEVVRYDPPHQVAYPLEPAIWADHNNAPSYNSWQSKLSWRKNHNRRVYGASPSNSWYQDWLESH
jgi:hypothetical protein